eukprot:TRINITY_DN10673_c0_g1_i1.p1 TRINITY_DN10673_c0_g1~~TRINITY_DN10673_c0_g1_i1.p1  ORF type:complete len:230 (+),score=26.63 TRINITY_DN10673_c0_g1_i1:37-726(+)
MGIKHAGLLLLLVLVGIIMYEAVKREKQGVDPVVKVELIHVEIREARSKKAEVEKEISSLEAEAEQNSNPGVERRLQAARDEYASLGTTIAELQSSIKPAYGVFSYQHLQEHCAAVYEAITNVEAFSMAVAWTFLGGSKALGQYLLGELVPYTARFFILICWSIPSTIWNYCDEYADFPAAVFMLMFAWVMSLLVAIAAVSATTLVCSKLVAPLAIAGRAEPLIKWIEQ